MIIELNGYNSNNALVPQSTDKVKNIAALNVLRRAVFYMCGMLDRKATGCKPVNPQG